jgi:hypothetical protein
MVEGDKKSKHIFSLGGWVQTTWQVKELIINVLQKANLNIQKKAYVVGLWIFKGRQIIWVAIDSLFRRYNISCLLSHIFILTYSMYPWDKIPYLTSYISTNMPWVGAMSLHVSIVIEIMIQCSNFCDVNLRTFWWGNGLMLELKWCNCKIKKIILFLNKRNQQCGGRSSRHVVTNITSSVGRLGWRML